MTDAQMLRELAALLERAFPEYADTKRLRAIADKLESAEMTGVGFVGGSYELSGVS